MRKSWCIAAVLVLTAGAPVFALPQTAPVLRITILGDSLDASEPPDRPIQGWGAYLQGELLGTQITNLALNGRSSKTFLHGDIKNGARSEPTSWITAQATPADFWIIKFGNNDSHPIWDQRHTKPETEYAANLKIFVEKARELGIQPILVTPPDRPFGLDAVARLAGYYSMANYAKATRRVAKQEDVPLIDLYSQSHVWFKSLGRHTLREYMPPKLRGHTSKAGAQFVARWMAWQLAKILPELKLTSANP